MISHDNTVSPGHPSEKERRDRHQEFPCPAEAQSLFGCAKKAPTPHMCGQLSLITSALLTLTHSELGNVTFQSYSSMDSN